LNAESKRVAIRTEWENKSEDHRLRALFPLGERVEVSHAEGHFDVVERRVFPKEKGNGWPEPYVPTMPQQGYVSLAGQRKGLTVINKGLPEFEILQDDSGTIALTLLRAVGWVSREDTLVRVGGAGPETPVPDAQSLGKNCVEYAIVPHLGDDQQAKVYSQAHDYLTPLYGSSTGHHDGHLEKDYRFFEMKGNHAFLLSACKKAEKKEAMILRFWNTSKAETEAKLTFFDCPSRIYRVDLKEEELSEPITTLEDGRFLLKAKGAEIVSLAIEF
jgi:mannosylglycerate hydrolase